MILDDGCKINNLNTTFLRGTVASNYHKAFLVVLLTSQRFTYHTGLPTKASLRKDMYKQYTRNCITFFLPKRLYLRSNQVY